MTPNPRRISAAGGPGPPEEGHVNELEYEIHNSGDDTRLATILPRLEEWFGEEMAELYRTPAPNTAGLLMVGAVWGEQYLARFDKYCLSTLLGTSNLRALQCATLLLYTDKASHPKLVSRMRSLEAMGIHFEARVIPSYVSELANAHPINKLWIIGTIHQAGVHIAGRRGMDYHMFLPDHLYPIDYMRNLLRLGAEHDGIAQSGVSANIDTAAADIERHRRSDGFLAIPDCELGEIAWQHLHKQFQNAVVGINRTLPNSHHMLWPGKDRLYHLNCRMNAAWIANSECRLAPTRIPATMDASIPFFMPARPYFPVAEDGLTFIEISDSTKYPGPDQRMQSWEQYCAGAWSTMNFDTAYLPYMRHLCETPIQSQNPGLDEAEIRRQHAIVVDKLESTHATAAIAFARAMSKGHG